MLISKSIEPSMDLEVTMVTPSQCLRFGEAQCRDVSGFFEEKVLRDVLESRGNFKKLVEVRGSKTTVEDVLKLFETHSIRATPVYELGPGGRKVYTGIVSVIDLLKFTTAEIFHSLHSDECAPPNLDKDDTEFLKRPVSEVLASGSDSVVAIHPETDSLRALVEAFSQHTLRALVQSSTDKSAQRLQLVSQTDIMRFMLSHASELPSLMATSVSTFFMPNPVVFDISHRTVDAFVMMYCKKVGAIGVVDECGILIANLSASDLRFLRAGNISDLQQPLAYFLFSTKGEVRAPLCCQPSDSLFDVISAILSHHVHRIWVVDADRRPVGLVTLTDVLRLISKSMSIVP
uniref:CBS domain-containing protein n=1 Tax=Cyanoptyche gloeocystis TaxID=77922 RepID=A0A7S2NQR0_9EUKA|mmetsp:Transcript_537/g.1051  ORF Transcript_537/g.1051 Transcript_537/m.1051 type:complete len:346 (+) Transcript_537:58-1095(+)